MTQRPINYQDELIIRGGQVFNREIYESHVGDIEKLLEDACVPQTHKILPLQFPSLLRNEWCMGHWFGITPKNQTLTFTEIQYVPFREAHGVWSVEHQFYVLNFTPKNEIPDDQFEISEGDERALRIKLDWCPKWYPPTGCRLFIMYQPAELAHTQGDLPPMMFLLFEDDPEPRTPKITNVFNTGNICTGNSFVRLVSNETDTFNKTKVALDAIRIAPANSDLRETDRNFIQWQVDAEGTTTQVHIPWEQDFGHAVTDERILEFTRMIRR